MRNLFFGFKSTICRIVACCFALTLLIATPMTALADTSWYSSMQSRGTNAETGYQLYIDDWADLLTDTEESQLKTLMEPITAHGHVAFVSISDNPTYSTSDYADEYYYDHFGYDSGTVFLIDMEERYIYIHSNGDIYDTVTKAYANTITDNSYNYASEGDYYQCAATAFEQINTLLEGRAIAQPMKYISNALLAIVLALLINYFVVMFVSRGRKPSNAQLLDGIYSKVEIHNPRMDLTNQTKRYSPQSSGSSGSTSRSSGGGFSGGGGGGGSRGGGGGHRF